MKKILLPVIATLLAHSLAHADVPDLGLTAKPVSQALAAQLDIAEGTGFVVKRVKPDSAAAALKLKKHDIVTKINGVIVKTNVSLDEIIADHCTIGEKASFEWIRKGKVHTGTTTISDSITEKELATRTATTISDAVTINKVVNSSVIQAGNIDDALKMLPEDIQKMVKQSSSFSSSSMTSNDQGSVSVSSAKDGKKKVKIKDNDDNLVFDQTISEEELDQVPDDFRETVAKAFSTTGNNSHVQMHIIGANGASFSGQSLDIDLADIMKQAAANNPALNDLDLSNTANFTMNATITMDSGNGKVTVSPAEGDKKNVLIKDTDGNIVFDDAITEDELDQVPEEYRKTVKGLVSGNMINIQINQSGSASGIGGKKAPKAEKDISDLLKDAGGK